MSNTKIHPLWHGFTYFQHQIEGIHWMLEKEREGITVPNRAGQWVERIYGGFQCDDMGLGKTIQITSAIINNIVHDTLLIAPLAMIDTWTQVLEKAGVLVYHLDTKQKEPWYIVNSIKSKQSIPRRFIKIRPAVYITNYEKLYSNPSVFRYIWDRIVLDEAHKIRNGDGEIARQARKLEGKIRWAVTGTPLVNSLKDVVSLLAFLGVPYSPLFKWEQRYVSLLPDIVIHRSINSLRGIISAVPPKPEIQEVILDFDTEDEEDFYLGIQGATESLVLRYADELLTSQMAFKLLLRLRQMSVHPQIYINAKRREDYRYLREDWIGSSTKLEEIRRIIEEDDDREDDRAHKYIIFCQFTDEMTLIKDYLVGEMVVDEENVLLYNGSMSKDERDAVLRYSKATEDRTVMLIQLQAGGVGLNLQEYDRIIFMSPWWTSALMDQAIARAVRMGQTEVVKVYHLKLSVEEKNSVNIDRLVNGKAEEKRRMLEKLFSMCSRGNNASESDVETDISLEASAQLPLAGDSDSDLDSDSDSDSETD
jgi:SNF2 family DNA or RNA helicase